MDDTPTPAPGPLARARAWLRGDRFMVDSRPPNPVSGTPKAWSHQACSSSGNPSPAEVATLQATAAGAMA